MSMLRCISPIDGSVFAERETLGPEAAMEVVAAARDAQGDWAARPLADRVALVEAGVARL
ncbi:MAG: aldehyde dehydrogenase family protein, partial [Pseudomonadota bacterium]